jgi:hypothetical protein
LDYGRILKSTTRKNHNNTAPATVKGPNNLLAIPVKSVAITVIKHAQNPPGKHYKVNMASCINKG